MACSTRFTFQTSVYLIGLFLFLSACNSASDSSAETVSSTEASNANLDTAKSGVKSNSIQDLVNSKDEGKLNASQLLVQELLEACVAQDYNKAASFIMYRGKDESRIGNDSFNPANANEANTVKVTCDVIVGWLGSSQSYEFISYQEEETEFGLQYIVEVMFKKEKLGIERHFFYLIDTPKGKLLVNMV